MLLSAWNFKSGMPSHSISLNRIAILQLYSALLFGCLLSAPAIAANGVTVIVSSGSLPSTSFVEEFRHELTQAGSKLAVNLVVLDNQGMIAAPTIDADDNVIAVGVQALVQASKLDSRTQVMGVLVPKPSFDKILQDSKRNTRSTSAIVLDQPYARQLELVKKILPKVNKLGVLLGPGSLDAKKELEQSATQQGLSLLYVTVKNASELSSGLKQVMEGSDALWAIPDPVIYSRETAQTILLTTYRYQKPVIGFSQAYVRAGALAAVYSTPQQIARQLAEELAVTGKAKNGMTGVRYPKYFSVDVNVQVGQSLGVDLTNEATLAEMLIRVER